MACSPSGVPVHLVKRAAACACRRSPHRRLFTAQQTHLHLACHLVPLHQHHSSALIEIDGVGAILQVIEVPALQCVRLNYAESTPDPRHKCIAVYEKCVKIGWSGCTEFPCCASLPAPHSGLPDTRGGSGAATCCRPMAACGRAAEHDAQNAPVACHSPCSRGGTTAPPTHGL